MGEAPPVHGVYGRDRIFGGRYKDGDVLAVYDPEDENLYVFYHSS